MALWQPGLAAPGGKQRWQSSNALRQADAEGTAGAGAGGGRVRAAHRPESRATSAGSRTGSDAYSERGRRHATPLSRNGGDGSRSTTRNYAGWSEVPAAFRDWAELEIKAASLRVWMPGIVHGLLQTEDYARALIRRRPPPGQARKQPAARLASRVERQQLRADAGRAAVGLVRRRRAEPVPAGGIPRGDGRAAKRTCPPSRPCPR